MLGGAHGGREEQTGEGGTDRGGRNRPGREEQTGEGGTDRGGRNRPGRERVREGRVLGCSWWEGGMEVDRGGRE